MKKKYIYLIFVFISFSFLIFKAPSTVSAACYPKNDWTGMCDAGRECSSGICCDTPAECNSANPADYNYSTHNTTGNVPAPVITPRPSADIHGKCGDKALSTAIGCIPALDTPEEFFGAILKWGVGIGGGIAFLLILYGGFMVMTSAGNPERLKAGQELLTSAISGLILLIFSVFILRFIGIDILGLGKLGFGQ